MASNSSKEEAPATCLVCNGPEEDDYHMVSCNQCRLWAHFKCAGVTEDIKDVDWHCQKCSKPDVQQLRVPRPQKKSSKKAGSKAESESVRSTGSIVDAAGRQLEEEERAKERALCEQMEIHAKRLEMTKRWNAKQLLLEREMRERELLLEREMQGLRLKQEQELLDKQLAAEREFVKRRDVIRQKIRSSQKQMEQFPEEVTPVDPAVIENGKVQLWLDEQKLNNHLLGDFRGAYPKTQTSGNRVTNEQFPEVPPQVTEERERDSTDSGSDAYEPEERSSIARN
ncbi:uncharacterized protein LOC131680483 [Topomyia yanbarensis]|uniref:uncharacterized protein LOC131680483 n=1 Tax=Topomyia yanbarensis TaxID=2498891 RepID=UPI00273B2946|nr:uncharacterized protein LOC131680483 [Topomyia yanbarensis]